MKIICPHGRFIRYEEPFYDYSVQVEDECPPACNAHKTVATDHFSKPPAPREVFAAYAPPQSKALTD